MRPAVCTLSEPLCILYEGHIKLRMCLHKIRLPLFASIYNPFRLSQTSDWVKDIFCHPKEIFSHPSPRRSQKSQTGALWCAQKLMRILREGGYSMPQKLEQGFSSHNLCYLSTIYTWQDILYFFLPVKWKKQIYYLHVIHSVWSQVSPVQFTITKERQLKNH